MSSPAGQIIYKAFAPTLKMALTIAAGYTITRMGMFSPAAGKGVSVVTMNVGLPALIFSSQVVAFTLDNIKAFGPLVLCAFLYQIIGFILAWVIKEVFYVPLDFQWGILVMGAISNWSNLPTAVVQTMATGAPFNPATDVELGVAYISIFVLVMNTVFFAFGAQKLCALDFRENVSTSKQAGFRDRWHSRFAGFQKWSDGRGKKQEIDPRKRDTSSSTSSALAVPVSYGSTKTAPTTTVGSSMPECEDKSTPTEECDRSPDLQSMTKMGGVPTRHKSRTPSFTSVMATISRIPPTEAPDAIDIGQQSSFDTKDIYGPTHSSGTHGNVLPVSSNYNTPQAEEAAPISSDQPKSQKYLDFLIAALKNVIHTPASVAVIIGLPCALIQPVKALFVVVDGWSVTRIPYAPDGKPPLAFIIDTTTFIGALAVPGGLILLGASFARLKMPKRWRDLPLAAIVAMVVVKMVLVPVFGVFFVQALRDKTTLFPSSDKIRIFVAILLSGTPAAANQLIVTQLYNPDGTADTIASFLLLQYIMMFVLCTAVAAVALYIVES